MVGQKLDISAAAMAFFSLWIVGVDLGRHHIVGARQLLLYYKFDKHIHIAMMERTSNSSKDGTHGHSQKMATLS